MSGAEAGFRPLLEAMADDAIERWWEPDVRRRLGRILAEDRGHRLGGGLALKRATSGDQSEEHTPEREDVGTVVNRRPTHLFGRHVPDGSQYGARIRRTVQGRGDRGAACGRRVVPRQAEVENFQPPIGGDEEILGFQIAVDDAFVVRSRQTARELHTVIGGAPKRQRAVQERAAQRLAFEQFGHRVRDAPLGADVVNGENIRMRERRDASPRVRSARATRRVLNSGGAP